ncbi:hypothetical protein QF035_000758 [Streptomyces umbrinus]|uniref:Transposase n=1 Tax=Streptomyces umbrinus TaxID=67370 RepID=A0ABU0SHX8_9ACTN|nr:hypothetical protein [Streptomyces umbrinus]
MRRSVPVVTDSPRPDRNDSSFGERALHLSHLRMSAAWSGSVTRGHYRHQHRRHPGDVDRCWQACLRRFDLEHTFRMPKQTLGWTKPQPRGPEVADRWTWLVTAAHAQLLLARPLAADLRRPWAQPAEPNRLTSARVRREFRHIRTKTDSPAGAPKPTRPGPGRPPGSKNRHPAIRPKCRPAPRHGRALYSPVPPQERDEASANYGKQQLRAQVRDRQDFSSAE